MRFHLLLLISGLFFNTLQAQNVLPEEQACKRKVFVPSVSVGTVGGAQITTNSVYQKYGGGVYGSIHNVLNERLSLGLGAGIEQIDNETLYPMYIEGRGLLSDKKATGFLTVSAGYAAGNNPSYENYEGYKYRGGGLFSAGWGYRWPLKNDDYLSVSTSFRQQFIHLDYSGSNNFSFKERLSYSLLSVRVAFDF